MTPHEKVKWVRLHHQLELKALAKEFYQILGSKHNPEKKFFELVEICDNIMAQYDSVTPCKKGCSFCCYQSLVIFEAEAKRIAKFSKYKFKHFQPYGIDAWKLEQRRDYLNQYTGVKCPFLIDNVCAIYPVRPIACRLYLSVDDDALNCDIKNRPNAKVPYVNTHEITNVIAQMMISSGQRIGDIREFFDEK